MQLTCYIYSDAEAIRFPLNPNIPLLRVFPTLDERIFRQVDNPAEADLIFYPFVLDQIFYHLWGSSAFRDEDWTAVVRWMRSLPHFELFEAKHVFVIHYDHDIVFGLNSVFLRCSLSKSWRDKRSFAIPFPFDDLGKPGAVKPKYLTSFMGAAHTSVTRLRLVNSRAQFGPMPHHFQTNDRFFGGFEGEQQANLRARYLEILQESVTVLCPRGTGRNSIRFFETLCAGKIPVFISDEAVLPYEDVVPYEKFVLRVPESDVHKTAAHVLQFLRQAGPEGLHEASQLARYYWENFLSNEVQQVQWGRMLLKMKR